MPCWLTVLITVAPRRVAWSGAHSAGTKLYDELYGQRNFVDEQRSEAVGFDDGRYAAFVQQAYKLGETVWGVFSMTRLTRTPEFRQAAAA